MANKKVWLIGLDGASFDIFEPMFAAGNLPVLKGLMDRGASGILESSVVPFTPQAWGSVITGNNPGKHGIFGFVRQMPGRPPEFLSSRTLQGDKIWTCLGRSGLESVIVNVPLSYPPDPLNGAMVTGMMTPSTDSEFTYPAELKERVLADWPDYKLDVTSSIDKSRSLAILEDLEKAMEMRVELTLKLIEERSPDFLFKVFVLPDRIQHAFCQFIHPKSGAYKSAKAEKWRERIWESYNKLDTAIGRLLDAADEGTDILFVSDHGFSVEQGGFFTNDFLARAGLLNFKNGKGPGAGTAGMMRGLIRRFNLAGIKRFVPNKMITKTINMTKESIDWSNTRAYASPLAQQGIYVNLQGREPEGIVGPGEYEHVREKILSEILGLEGPQAGVPPVRAWRREDLYDGPFVQSIPDIVLEFSASSLEAKDAVLGGDPLSWSDGSSRGIHHRDGFFLAAGPRVHPGKCEGLVLEDIAPNILTLFGVPGPEAMDGRIRNDIFAV